MSHYTTIQINSRIPEVYSSEGAVKLPDALRVTAFADEQNPYIPTAHDNYKFRHETFRNVLGFLRKPNGDALFIAGPTGSGKTSCITELAARLNWPVQQITLNGRFEFAQLKGQLQVVPPPAGSSTPVTQFIHGPLARAMKYGHILLLNEIDMADPAELAGLNDVLEGRPLVIAENRGEIIKPHPMFRVVATANSFGSGDESGLYQGVQTQNIASLDRYRFVKVDYPDQFVEKAILKQVCPSLIDEIVEGMVLLANHVRKLFIGTDSDGGSHAELSVTISTRNLVRWGQLAVDFRNAPNCLKYALDMALLERCNAEDRQVINNIAISIFGDAWG